MNEVPLTTRQKLRLIVPPAMRLAVWSLAFALIATALAGLVGEKQIWLLIFTALFALASAHATFNAARDVIDGYAIVTEDTIDSSSSGRTYRATFKRLGRMTLTSGTYVDAMPRARHRVTYSPFTKTVWKLEMLD